MKGPGRRELESVHCHVPIRNFIVVKSGLGRIGTGVPSIIGAGSERGGAGDHNQRGERISETTRKVHQLKKPP